MYIHCDINIGEDDMLQAIRPLTRESTVEEEILLYATLILKRGLRDADSTEVTNLGRSISSDGRHLAEETRRKQNEAEHMFLSSFVK